MAYTVSYLYEKVLDGLDKIGSELFTLEYVINRLHAATYDFIGESVKYIENTQEIRDDIRTLYKPFTWDIINIPVSITVNDPYVDDYQGAYIPDDYLHMMAINIIDVDLNVRARDTRLIRHGQLEIYLTDPNKKPTKEYPLVILYNNLIRVYSDGTPVKAKGFYLKKPTFWVYSEDDDIEIEIAVNLPDNSVDKIIKDIINDILIIIGDPRSQTQYQTKEQYRKRGNNSLN